MRLLWSAAVLAAASSSVSAFAPVNNGAAVMRSGVAMSAVATADVKAKQDASIEKLKAKDASSSALSGDVSILTSDHGGVILNDYMTRTHASWNDILSITHKQRVTAPRGENWSIIGEDERELTLEVISLSSFTERDILHQLLQSS